MRSPYLSSVYNPDIEYFEDGAKGCALRLEKMHFVQNVETNAGIGQKGAFFKGLDP